ncbi:transcript variant X1 [Nothobranchius furzeri]|uniref:Transcript variant X1 n=2 Tax=Nothobranchius furzeri TaxID=105023 RepID=A0A9D2Z1Q7_NOTFU|nr:transcript variant X1 [Nothobranchius furzeri]
MNKEDKRSPMEPEEPGKDQGEEEEEEEEEEEGENAKGLELLLKKLKSDKPAVPMDSNLSLSRPESDGEDSSEFTRERVFKAASQGNKSELIGLLDFLLANHKQLTSSDFIDETNGKTALLKALLNIKDGKNEAVEVLLDIADKTGDLKELINSSYTDPCYKDLMIRLHVQTSGQTALHIAIERRSFEYVKLLVQKGADVQAKANGSFFQHGSKRGFYFGELPLSLAACTNQLETVCFLMENPHRNADVTDRDSQGNTVLHTLVIIADSKAENTEMAAKIYDEILIRHFKLQKHTGVQLELIENHQGLTPLKLAAKLGKIGMFRHMLTREFMDEEARPLSRKFTEWVYGPVHSSLYDMSSIDTDENNSVLEIIVFGSQIPNRPEMLRIEPLRSLLRDKWERFASKLFLMSFVMYLIYLAIFTTVAFYRKEGEPPFPVENTPADCLRCVGEIISVLGAVRFLYKAITIFWKNPPQKMALFTDGFSEILFFLQAALLLLSAVLYFCGQKEYVGLLVLSLALAWMNVLYFTRGSRQLGMYNVMMQRMILSDLLHFLCVYSVLLFGFSAAVVTLLDDSSKVKNVTLAGGGRAEAESSKCDKPSYHDIRFTTLELFKFTIGMGDLQFTNHVQYKEVFYILLISYITLTYILMLNMLIALMGNTVQKISDQSETIWNLRRAITILDMERSVPKWLRSTLHSRASEIVCFGTNQDKCRRFVRVTERNWKKWRSDLSVKLKEDPANQMMKVRMDEEGSGNTWTLNHLLQRIRARGRQPPRSDAI